MASWVWTAASFIAESGASATVQKIVDAGFEFLGNLMQPTDSDAELKRLKTALPQIRSAMDIAEALKARNPSYGEWFKQFRNAVDAFEDVLDELEYKKLEEEVERQEALGGSTTCPKKQKTCPISKEILGRLKEAISRLDQELGDVDRLLQHAKSLGIDDFSESWKEISKVFRSETTSFLIETKVFGRDEEKEKIFGWLKQSTGEPLSVLGIVGMGGLGKTTLAQLAYQEMKESNYFEHTIWVCVSVEFSIEGLTKKILGELGENNCGDKPLNALQEILKKNIQSKKIFLILDDIWDDDIMKRKYCDMSWEHFIAPLKFTQEGSKILFTTRMKSVADFFFAKVIRTKHEHESIILQGLEEKDLASLFYNYAFHNNNPDDHSNLRELGDQIVKMLWGSPLAAKVIGSLLSSNMHCDYWKKILSNGSVLNIDQAKYVVEVLKLSYYHLPADLQVCFRFCSIFPQDYVFAKNELIKMWIAAGFIPQQQCYKKQPEDVGEDYFNYLLRKSFFEYSKSWKGEGYIMHDLMHDLAERVSDGECCRVESNDKMLVIPASIRHISVPASEIEKISHLKNLHSLIITSDPHTADNLDPFVLPKEIIKSLRLLRISTCRNCQLPEGISDLIHLRYLSSRSMLIPAGIHKLYHLQVLDLPLNISSYNFSVEPSRLNNLVKLRYMRLPEELLRIISGVHKMTSLQELTFFIGEGDGHYINELGTLKYLRKLSIYNIENVGDPVEAKSADLLGKKNLRSLSLKWSSDSNPSNSEQIIENLKPSPDLTRLIIVNYEGQRYPNWMKDTPVLNLSVLKLHGCPRLKDELFSCHVQNLKILDIYECPELDKLPDMPLSLTEFRVKKVGLTSLPNLHQNSSGSTTESLKSSLICVHIENCQNITSLNGFLQQEYVNFQSLEYMDIRSCSNLEQLPNDAFGKFLSLTYLTLSNCAMLKAVNDQSNLLPISVKSLSILNCGQLDAQLLESASRLTTLRTLWIMNCANITHIPCSENAFRSLSSLDISGCDKLIEHSSREPANGVNLNGINLAPLKINSLLIDNLSLLLGEPLRSLRSISTLAISNWSGIDTFAQQWLLQNSGSLRSLAFHKATLKSLPTAIVRLTALEGLQIYDCDLLEKIQELPCSLKWLRILHAKSLKSLPATMVSLTALEHLEIIGADQLEELPELPTSLRDWYFFGAKSLKSLPATMGSLTALQDLGIENADSLHELPELPRCLKFKYIRRSDGTELCT